MKQKDKNTFFTVNLQYTITCIRKCGKINALKKQVQMLKNICPYKIDSDFCSNCKTPKFFRGPRTQPWAKFYLSMNKSCHWPGYWLTKKKSPRGTKREKGEFATFGFSTNSSSMQITPNFFFQSVEKNWNPFWWFKKQLIFFLKRKLVSNQQEPL